MARQRQPGWTLHPQALAFNAFNLIVLVSVGAVKSPKGDGKKGTGHITD
jgi:hypothetical protein